MPISVRLLGLLRSRPTSHYYSSISPPKNKEQMGADGTEVAKVEKERPVDISSTTGAPRTIQTNRSVYIYQAAKSGMTSGRSHINSRQSWLLEFDHAQERWENPLMGWTSTRDTLNQLNLKFASADDAVRFAEKNGWRYKVQEHTQESAWKSKSYSNNFKYSPGKLRYIPTK